jgi:hypothetical protein
MSFGKRKIILSSLGGVALTSWFLFIYFYYYYFIDVAPITSNPATGQIYEVSNHGYIVYLTKQQMLLAYIPFGVAAIAVITAVLLEMRWKIYGKPGGHHHRQT